MRLVGWVEQRDTHRSKQGRLMGIAALNPSYQLRAGGVTSRRGAIHRAHFSMACQGTINRAPTKHA